MNDMNIARDKMNSTTKTTYITKTVTMTDKGRITTIVTTHFEPIEKKKKPCCYRCGRNTHMKPDCYATFHLKGYEIYD
jgi:hypothetical protein